MSALPVYAYVPNVIGIQQVGMIDLAAGTITIDNAVLLEGLTSAPGMLVAPHDPRIAQAMDASLRAMRERPIMMETKPLGIEIPRKDIWEIDPGQIKPFRKHMGGDWDMHPDDVEKDQA